MEPLEAANKPSDHLETTSLEGSLDWRKLFDDWRDIAYASADRHYDAQRRFNRRGRWLGGCATLLTALTAATAIKEIGATSNEGRWVVAAIAALAGVLTALQTYLKYEARAASHRSTAAGYAMALRKINEVITFGRPSWSELQKAADSVRGSLDALSRDAPEVPADIQRRKYPHL